MNTAEQPLVKPKACYLGQTQAKEQEAQKHDQGDERAERLRFRLNAAGRNPRDLRRG